MLSKSNDSTLILILQIFKNWWLNYTNISMVFRVPLWTKSLPKESLSKTLKVVEWLRSNSKTKIYSTDTVVYTAAPIWTMLQQSIKINIAGFIQICK